MLHSIIPQFAWMFQYVLACRLPVIAAWCKTHIRKIRTGQELSNVTLLFLVPLFYATSAVGACWQEEQARQSAMRVARAYFPDVAAQLPLILVCERSEFPVGVAGDFNGGAWRIRLNQDQMQFMDKILAHELGHAATHLRGLDDGTYGGHGPGWQRVMIGAGLFEEAARMAQITGQHTPQPLNTNPQWNPQPPTPTGRSGWSLPWWLGGRRQQCRPLLEHMGRFIDQNGIVFDQWREVLVCN
jgi:hypothetical protein